MYAYFKGELEDIGSENIVVDVGGIGYNIKVSEDVISKLPALHYKVQIYTYTSVREDAIQLYGFLTPEDLKMFRKLITVSGIGPKAAQAILSVMDADALKFAIISGDSKAISKAPGVGGKSAERIILELKDKVSIEDTFSGDEGEVFTSTNDKVKNEAIEALIALGYSPSDAIRATSKIVVTEDMSVETMLKMALKNIY